MKLKCAFYCCVFSPIRDCTWVILLNKWYLSTDMKCCLNLLLLGQKFIAGVESCSEKWRYSDIVGLYTYCLSQLHIVCSCLTVKWCGGGEGSELLVLQKLGPSDYLFAIVKWLWLMFGQFQRPGSHLDSNSIVKKSILSFLHKCCSWPDFPSSFSPHFLKCSLNCKDCGKHYKIARAYIYVAPFSQKVQSKVANFFLTFHSR